MREEALKGGACWALERKRGRDAHGPSPSGSAVRCGGRTLSPPSCASRCSGTCLALSCFSPSRHRELGDAVLVACPHTPPRWIRPDPAPPLDPSCPQRTIVLPVTSPPIMTEMEAPVSLGPAGLHGVVRCVYTHSHPPPSMPRSQGSAGDWRSIARRFLPRTQSMGRGRSAPPLSLCLSWVGMLAVPLRGEGPFVLAGWQWFTGGRCGGRSDQ